MKEKVIVATVLTIVLISTMLTIAPVQASPEDIKIGIIGPQGLPHWSPAGMKEGSEMARDEINAAGGVNVGGTYRNISLVFANEYSYPSISVPDAQAQVDWLYGQGCRVIIGGFRTEVTGPMIETAMGKLENVIFLINGASTNELISDRVPVNYEYYKYLFRVNPVNSTALLKTVGGSIQYLAARMLAIFGCYNPEINKTQVKVAVLTEALDWTLVIHDYFTNPAKYPYVLGPLVNVTYSDRIPPYPTPVTTKPWLDAANASKARILIHVFSAPVGRKLIYEWKALGVGAGKPYTYMPVGINVMAQLQDHWNPQPPWPPAPGACEYESILNFIGTETPVTPQATKFWSDFTAKTGGIWPIYTAFGAYDAVYLVKETIEDSGVVPESGWTESNADTFVTTLEGTDRTGLTGKFRFTTHHDVFCNSFGPTWEPPPKYVRALMVQWLSGRMEVVCPADQFYSKRWAIPTWMYPLDTDMNYDGNVDMKDIGPAARAFGTWPGHARWEKEADMNYDNKVDMKDIGNIARNFGKKVTIPICPDP